MNICDAIKNKLGFGLMRLPTNSDETVDEQRAREMVDLFLQSGGSYFDTAYVYHAGCSETVAGRQITNRYARERFTLATKMPVWKIEKPAELEPIFAEQLRRCNTGYFDFYLLHSLNNETAKKCDALGAWDFLQQLKAEERARFIGFSWHGTADVLDEYLAKHPWLDFVQLQLNYLDWNSPKIQARLCYETARKRGKPIIVMEPLKGGALANCPPQIARALKAAFPGQTPASLALRFVLSLEGILCVLSGMGDLGQVRQNLMTVQNFAPLSAAETESLLAVAEQLRALGGIPCTSCRYCVNACPVNMPIDNIFHLLNSFLMFGYQPYMNGSYEANTRTAKAGDCIKCGACETHCPQGIDIVKKLEQAAGIFENPGEPAPY